MESAFTLGLFLCSLLMSRYGKRYSLPIRLSIAFLLVPISLLFLGNSTVIYMSILSIAILGLAIPLFNISMQTLIQTQVPTDSLGKFMGTFSSVMAISNPIGLIILPLLFDLVGLPITLTSISLLYFTIAIVVILSGRLKRLT